MQYRSEIDGLRALAVVPVVLFHASIPGFNGGYVGVDIFFVISGYLITSIILNDLQKERFSFVDFYHRRAKRILPALLTMLLVTTIVAYLVLPPKLLQMYSQSLVSVVTFSSNVYFYSRNGYFDVASEELPLLHTWSLSVEEQYYIFFPLLVFFMWRYKRAWLPHIILLIGITSFLLSNYLVYKNAIAPNFYLIFSRAWELLSGALLAIYLTQSATCSHSSKQLWSFAGLLMVIASITLYQQSTPFPSVFSLLPVGGTLLIIRFADKSTIVGQLLSQKSIVYVGLISYSLYLWHQPIFAFLRILQLGEPSASMFFYAIVTTLIVSIASYLYIEKPARHTKVITHRQVFGLSFAALSIVVLTGFIGHYYQGFEARYSTPSYASSIQSSPFRETCHTSGEDFLSPSSACTLNNFPATWATLGDSHTVEVAHALADHLKPKEQGVKQLSFSRCAPALTFEVEVPGCKNWINQAVAMLEKDKAIKNVLVGFRYTAFLFGEQMKTYPELPNETPPIVNNIGMSKTQLRDAYWHGLSELIFRLRKSGKTVYLLYPIPELPEHIEKVVSPYSVFSDNPRFNLSQTTSANYYFERNDFILKKLNSLRYGHSLRAVHPFEVLCDSRGCPAISSGRSLYFDDDHLSNFGADLIVQNGFNLKIKNKALIALNKAK